MIELKDVSKTYRTGVKALRNINLTISDGEFCFIVGKSGSGKSTLVRLLTKELDTDSGSIIVNDTDLRKLRRSRVPAYRRRLGVVFQDFRLLEDRTVYENIAFAQLIIGKSDAEIFENVTKILGLTGLSSKADSYPRQLSGGEQQRTAIARALVNRPEILIADEPTGNLDHENAEEIMKLLERINAQGTTVIVITHDREMVNRMNRRTVSMSMGEIISDRIPGTASGSATYTEDSAKKSILLPFEKPELSVRKPFMAETPEEAIDSEEKTDWTEDWEEDWDEEEDWLDDEFDSPVYSEKKPTRGLRGAHRPHHKSAKEGTK
ncbi:cell division ATP-binding protein FtsE [Oribacterium sp. C9]|nr:cell division ATP-binding protein FtsE [Oribacterium sp. C9]OON85833.1 cell division ATP-binding protein FtsE [Oribacterium sp. C9]